MARRVRASKQQHQSNIKKAPQEKNRGSPSSFTDGISHGSFDNGDNLPGEVNPDHKVGLLRGFGPSPSGSFPSSPATKLHQNRTTGILLRDFGPPLLSKNDVDDAIPVPDATDGVRNL